MIYSYITHSPFTARDAQRYGINFFLSKGYKVIVIDVTYYTNKELRDTLGEQYTINHPNIKIYYPKDFLEFKESSCFLKNGDIALLALGNNYQNIKVKKYLKAKGLKIGLIQAALLPPIITSKVGFINKVKKTINRLHQTKLIYIIMKFFDIIYKKINNVNEYDFIITNNFNTFQKENAHILSNTVIEAQSLDSDRVLELKEKKYENERKYIVFLDQYLTGHTDFIRMGVEFPVTKEKYFPSLFNFFEKIEKKYGHEIIIALHPRTDDEYKSMFKNYKTEIFKSEILVKNAEFVITHFSTAINFAVIYEKPIYFIITNEMKDTYQSTKEAKCYSSVLGRNCINIDKIDSLPLLEKIDKSKYFDYKEKYIKKEDLPDRTIWESFLEMYIKKDNNDT